MSIERLFPTQIYTGRPAAAARLGPRLLRESRQLRLDDASGRRWSARNYPGGYTSYGSACRMHRLSPTFAALERAIDPHVRVFARALEFDLTGRALAMTDCWVNIMPRGTAHGLHLHPLATISGTFYLKAPRGCAALKIEDPRLDRMMAAPPRRRGASRANRPWVQIPAQAGALVLFESWLRHEVPANPAGERVSISFNYGWF
ncbi:MAG: TIGR02466 family protein [Steroidobacteraceae bacterium]